MAKDKTAKRIIIVGGGISGLLATIKVCEAGGEVDLFSYCPGRHQCLHGHEGRA